MKLYISACEEYPLHELEVTDWLAKEKELDIFTGEILIYSETDGAYQIDTQTHGYGRAFSDFI